MRHTRAWQSSTSVPVGGAPRGRASCQPRARACSTAVTSAGHHGDACRSAARSAPGGVFEGGQPAGGQRVVVVGEAVATAGVRWRLIRHQRAAAAWSSGRSPSAVAWREQAAGVEADAGELGEPVGQDGQVRVAVGGGRQLVEQRRPFGDGGGEVVDDAPVEPVLPAGLGGGVLAFAGGAGVGVGRPCAARQTARSARVAASGRTLPAVPSRGGRWRQRLGAHLLGQVEDELVARVR